MTRHLKANLDAIFSLLPERQAEEAKRRFLEQSVSRPETLADELKWTEFDQHGRFLRGGCSNISDLSTRLVANSQEDPDIHELALRGLAGGIQPGALERVPGKQRFHWFLPFTPTRPDRLSRRLIRGLCVTEALFAEVLHLFNPSADLSASETRVIFQTLSGVGLREAAATDRVSYETKRAHVKNACLKLDCSGQKYLVRKVLGQMVHLLSISDSEAVHAEVLEAYVSRYLSNDVRLVVQRLPNGRLMRVLESGPQTGTPVIMIHGLMFPISLYGIAAHLNSANVRLIVPVREGYLESRSVFSLYSRDDLLTSSLNDIALYMKQNFRRPAVVLGNSLGAVASIRFATRHPELVSRLILLSINLTRTVRSSENFAGHFYGGLRTLTDRPDLFRLVNWQFRKYYADESICREILLRLFGSSQADIDVLEGRISGVPGHRMFSDLYQSSTSGVADDFGFVMKSWQREVGALDMPVIFIHGSRDPLTKIDEFRDIANSTPNNHIVAVVDGGHFISVSHASEVWQHIARLAAAGGGDASS